MPALAVAALALSLAAAPALASAPPLPQAVEAGTARLTYWGFQVYDAQLWVTPGFRRSRFGEHAFALQLQYLRDFKAADIASRSLQEMARGGPIPPQQARRWESALVEVLRDVRAGDRILGVHQPGRGAEFFYNGRRTGEIADAEFAPRFFGIWLAPHSSEPALRDALLAGTAP
jgi:hypothetical protein